MALTTWTQYQAQFDRLAQEYQEHFNNLAQEYQDRLDAMANGGLMNLSGVGAPNGGLNIGQTTQNQWIVLNESSAPLSTDNPFSIDSLNSTTVINAQNSSYLDLVYGGSTEGLVRLNMNPVNLAPNPSYPADDARAQVSLNVYEQTRDVATDVLQIENTGNTRFTVTSVNTEVAPEPNNLEALNSQIGDFATVRQMIINTGDNPDGIVRIGTDYYHSGGMIQNDHVSTSPLPDFLNLTDVRLYGGANAELFGIFGYTMLEMVTIDASGLTGSACLTGGLNGEPVTPGTPQGGGYASGMAITFVGSANADDFTFGACGRGTVLAPGGGADNLWVEALPYADRSMRDPANNISMTINLDRDGATDTITIGPQEDANNGGMGVTINGWQNSDIIQIYNRDTDDDGQGDKVSVFDGDMAAPATGPDSPSAMVYALRNLGMYEQAQNIVASTIRSQGGITIAEDTAGNTDIYAFLTTNGLGSFADTMLNSDNYWWIPGNNADQVNVIVLNDIDQNGINLDNASFGDFFSMVS